MSEHQPRRPARRPAPHGAPRRGAGRGPRRRDGLVAVVGAAYLWPLFIFPLVLAAVFFFELGSLAVTFWLGNFFVAYFSFRAAPRLT